MVITIHCLWSLTLNRVSVFQSIGETNCGNVEKWHEQARQSSVVYVNLGNVRAVDGSRTVRKE